MGVLMQHPYGRRGGVLWRKYGATNGNLKQPEQRIRPQTDTCPAQCPPPGGTLDLINELSSPDSNQTHHFGRVQPARWETELRNSHATQIKCKIK